jgi:formyltetrahydrofolate synthetase
MHGGGPPVTAGQPLDATYRTENVQLLTAGCCNLQRHIGNMASYGVPVVVAINRFATDTDAELAAVKQAAMDAGQCCLTALRQATTSTRARASHSERCHGRL